MHRVTSAIFLIVALFSAAGGQLAILQVTAWTGMVINYSRESGLIRGFERTFSGEEPCRLCHLVERAQKESEQEPPSSPKSTQIEPEVFEAPEPFVSASIPSIFLQFMQFDPQGPQRIYPVPVPPPRQLG